MNLNPAKLSHETRRDIIVAAKVISPFLFILILFAHFHEFVINAILANIGINSLIILASLYGVILILNRLRSAQMDFRIIERFGKEALSGIPMEELLEEPWLKSRYVRHYLTHIAVTGGELSSQLDQNAIENELHALAEEYESRLELPQFIVGFMIAMGLLGTFIGLLTTLTGISGMLDGMGATGTDIQKQFMGLVVELRKPLAGMGIAFSASMFGLVTSLMLAIMMTNLRRFINRVMNIARNVMHDLVELRRPGPAMMMTGTSVAESEMTPSQAASTVMLVGRVDLLAKKIELLMQSFEVSIAGTQKLNELLGFGPRMKETSEKSLEELKSISLANGELQRLTQKLIDNNSTTIKAIANVVDVQRQTKETGEKSVEAIKALSTGQGEQSRLLQKLVDLDTDAIRVYGNMLEAQRQVSTVNEKSLDELRALLNGNGEQRQIEQTIVDAINDNGRIAEGAVSANRSSHAEMVSSMRDLSESLSKIQEVDVSASRHLWEIKENLTKLCSSFNMLDLVSGGISQQSVLLETLVEEMRKSQTILLSIQKGLQPNNV